MAAIDNQIINLEQDTRNANKVKELVVGNLIKQGLISEEDGMDYVERVNVMIYKGSWFERFYNKFVKNNKNNKNSIDGYFYTVVEMAEKKPMTLNDIDKK